VQKVREQVQGQPPASVTQLEEGVRREGRETGGMPGTTLAPAFLCNNLHFKRQFESEQTNNS